MLFSNGIHVIFFIRLLKLDILTDTDTISEIVKRNADPLNQKCVFNSIAYYKKTLITLKDTISEIVRRHADPLNQKCVFSFIVY